MGVYPTQRASAPKPRLKSYQGRKSWTKSNSIKTSRKTERPRGTIEALLRFQGSGRRICYIRGTSGLILRHANCYFLLLSVVAL